MYPSNFSQIYPTSRRRSFSSLQPKTLSNPNYNSHKATIPKNNSYHNSNKSQTKPKIPLYLRELIIPPAKCPDCKVSAHIIEDRRNGRTICKKCSLIIEDHIISEQSEWRNFDDRTGPDPNRIGSVQNYYLKEIGNLHTQIGTSSSSSLNKTHNKLVANLSNNKLTKGIQSIERYGTRLNLSRDSKNFSCELYREVISKLYMRGQYFLNVVVACVYIGCNQCNQHKSLDYLCYEFIVDKKKVIKIFSTMQKLKSCGKLTLPIVKKGKGYIQRSTHEIYAVNFGKQLKLNIDTIKNLQKIARKIADKHLLSGKKPQTVAAATVYLTCIVNGDITQHRCYKEISNVAKISEHTIKKAFREHLYLKAATLLPDGYGDSKRISNIKY